VKQKRAKKEHPVSEAQRRWAFAAEAEGKLPKGKAREWSHRVKGQHLPAHTSKSLDPIDSLVKGDGKGKTVTTADATRAAKRFGIRWDRARFSLEDLRTGMQVELEHTASKMRAADIAIDHLVEAHGYYNRLREVEGEGAPDTTREKVTTRPDMTKGNTMHDPIEALAKAFPPKKKPPPQGAGDEPADPYVQQDQDYGDDTSGAFDGDDDSDTEVPDQDDDGVPDDNEFEDENDDEFEGQDGDADADGVPDEADLDDDNDGQPDAPGEGAGEGLGGEDGDLESDVQPGDPNAVISKLAALERDYYAAKGMHGAGHHKTEALLDQYHRAVRELVRDVAGGQGGQAPQPGMPPGDSDDDGVSDDVDDEDGIDSDGDGSDQDSPPPFGAKPEQGKKPPFGGASVKPGQGKPPAKKPTAFGGGTKPSPKPMQGKDAFQGKPEGKPQPKKKPPFGKSVDAIDALRGDAPLKKSLYDFASSGGTINSQFLMPYLVAFIETAYEACAAEAPSDRYALDAMSCAIMCKLVSLLPKNTNLNAAATKYKITAEGIAKILKDRGIVSAEEAEASRAGLTGEDESLEAMGAGGIGGAVLTTKSWFDVDDRDPLLKGADGVRGVARAYMRSAQVVLVDDTIDPGKALAKAQRAVTPSFLRHDEEARPNINGSCMIHGHADLTKSQNLWNPHARCTCPRN